MGHPMGHPIEFKVVKEVSTLIAYKFVRSCSRFCLLGDWAETYLVDNPYSSVCVGFCRKSL